MKRGYVYTLIFMLIVSVVFATVLAVANEAARPAIAANRTLAEEKAILYAFDADTSGSGEAISSRYRELVRERSSDGFVYFEHVGADGQVQGYALPFSGGGLWGGIRGYLALKADFSALQGLVFTEQNETPGLGGRIDEDWYKEQFRDVPAGTTLTYDGGLDAITGATQTSNAVLRILNEALAEDVKKLEDIVHGG